MRAVSVRIANGQVEVTHQSDVRDGENVRKTYKMVKLQEIQRYDYRLQK